MGVHECRTPELLVSNKQSFRGEGLGVDQIRALETRRNPVPMDGLLRDMMLEVPMERFLFSGAWQARCLFFHRTHNPVRH